MISIQTNVNSLVAQQNLSVNSAFQSKTIQQLTSGYRINQSGDDAAGLAVANKFRSTIAELTQGVANGNDATAQLQIMDGGMNNISLILDRLKTLATQSASGTFTGNRSVLNAEFQNALSEIDRQAQSIGLNTGGLFAKNLDVFLGAGSGSSSLQNGIVTLGLTGSAVDSQSLGMKGMQALAGTTDIGTGSTTSVALIMANATNQGSTATGGTTDFYFAGPGFSDASKVKVSVNLSGVSDIDSLVTALNAALVGAGTGTSQASAAFAKAGVVASVHTDNSGGKQLSFTSSTSAFQVEAGDRMANALMGNLSGTTGAALTTTVTGGLTAASGSFSPTNVTVRIQGAGLSGPVDLTFDAGSTLMGGAITDLVNKVSQNSDLKAAGISLSGTAGAALVFTSARGESFNVMATNDTANKLGLGSFVTNSSSSYGVDYNTIIGAAYANSTANDQATMQFSVNGAATTAVSVDLTAGDAVAAARTSTAIANPTITAGNNALTFSVDGIAVAATLSGSSAATVSGAGALFAGTVNIAAATAGNNVGALAVTGKDFTAGGAVTFTVAVDGGVAQTITLSGNLTTAGNGAGSYSNAINSQLVGATAVETAGVLTITSNSTGALSSIALTDGVGTVGKSAVSSGAVVGADFTGGGVGAMEFSVDTGDGSGPHTVQFSTAITDAQGYANVINATGALIGKAHAIVSGALGDRLQIVSDVTGTSSLITLAEVTGTPLATYLKIATGAGTAGNGPALATYLHNTAGSTGGVAGNNQLLVSSNVSGPALVTLEDGAYTSANVVLNVNTALFNAGLLDNAGTPTSGIIASLVGNNLVLTSSTVGALSSLQVAAPPTVANSALTAIGLTGTLTGTGGSATAASLAATIQSAIDAATGTGTTNAHATVTVSNDNKITITNDHKGAAHTISAFAGTAATGAVGPLVSYFGVGASIVAGANRTGADLVQDLNQQFASNSTLQPAQLTATWGAGSLTIASGNNTNFRVNSGSTGSGVVTGSVDLTAGHDWSGGGAQSFRLRVDGTLSADIALNTATTTAAQVLTAVQDALTAASVTGVTASLDSGSHLVFTSDSTGATSNVQVEGPVAGGLGALTTLGLKTLEKTADADLGFGVSGATFTAGNLASGTPLNHIIDAGGASSANVTANGLTNALTFSALKYGNDAQAITISGNDTDGTQRSLTVTLKNIDTGAASENRAGRTVDEAISYINTQLQQSNIATLQRIVAVKEKGSAGDDQINFVSSLSSFNVSVASTANADGVNLGISENVAAGVVGDGANMQVDTKEAAKAAVTAIATAIGLLGSAQAAVGKGQNQLYYAVNLAQSQITNFSAAESYLRDANVALQAANLTKAQVLSQASIAAMAQANSAPQAVLALLRG